MAASFYFVSLGIRCVFVDKNGQLYMLLVFISF
jgi:hypothetical protein